MKKIKKSVALFLVLVSIVTTLSLSVSAESVPVIVATQVKVVESYTIIQTYYPLTSIVESSDPCDYSYELLTIPTGYTYKRLADTVLWYVDEAIDKMIRHQCHYEVYKK